MYNWDFWARPKQLPPDGQWRIWLLLTGRGYGKTRAGAEWVRQRVESGKARRIALVADTPADARDVMIEGESGLLNVCPPWDRPLYEPSKRRLTWKNGAVATIYSSHKANQLRGPQHDSAWCDELAAWKYPQETWDMLMFGLRLGDDPRVIVTTTPKPIPIIKELVARSENPEDVRITRGTTYENRANLAPPFFAEIIRKYEGTRLGRQELTGEILDDAPGALWKRATLDKLRLTEAPILERIVVAIDPAVSVSDTSSETGIVVAGVGYSKARGERELHGFVLDDRTVRAKPDAWAKRAVNAYEQYEADRIIGEVNNGGDMIEHTIHTVDPKAAYKQVRASRGKAIRAEPIAALYEQGLVHHVGTFGDLEDQLCSWEPGDPSPDRLDALVWALTELMLGRRRNIGKIDFSLNALLKRPSRWKGR